MTVKTFRKKCAGVETLYGITQGTDASAIFGIIHSPPDIALFQDKKTKQADTEL